MTKERLLALKELATAILVEVEGALNERQEIKSAPRRRRNLKTERVLNHELNYATGKWSPKKR